MKVKYWFILKKNIKNLNLIPATELTEEILDYGLKHGFSYKDEIDDRYLKYDNYVLSNLERFDEYKYIIVSDDEVIKRFRISNYFSKLVNSDVKIFIKLLKCNVKIINMFDFDSNYVSDYDMEEILNLLYEKLDYTEIPVYFRKNIKLGLKYLKADINNLRDFLYYNEKLLNVEEFIKYLINIPNFMNNPMSFDYIIENIEYIEDNEIINKIIKIYPELIDKIDIIKFNDELLSTVIDLIIDDKYVVTSKTNDKIIRYISSNLNIILSKNPKAFFYLCRYIYCDKESLFKLCMSSNYLLSSKSPDFLKKNEYLVIESLKKNTISFDDVNLEYFCDCSVDIIKQLIEISKSLNYTIPPDIMIKFEQIIFNSVVFKPNEEGVLHLRNGEKIGSINVNYIEQDINTIVISYMLIDSNIDEINKVISDIKNSGRNIRLLFSLGLHNIDTEFLEKIVDLEYIYVSSRGDDLMSGKELLKINKTLELFAKDIKESDLSPLEKYIAIYDIVKGFKEYRFFNDSKKMDGIEGYSSRSIYKILYNDYIVCTGYANMLEFLLKYVGIPSTTFSLFKEGHTILYAHLKDEKYGIDTVVKSDVTNDTTQKDILNSEYGNIFQEKDETSMDYALQLKIDKIEEYEVCFVLKCLAKLFPEYSKNGKKEITDYINFFNSIRKKDVMMVDLFNAILRVKEFVYKTNFSQEELDDKRKYLQVKLSDDKGEFEKDIKDIEEQIKNLNILEILKIHSIDDSYKALCINNIINDHLAQINFKDRIMKFRLSVTKSGLTLLISLDDLMLLSDYLLEENLIIPEGDDEYLNINLNSVVENLTFEEAMKKLDEFYSSLSNHYLNPKNKVF